MPDRLALGGASPSGARLAPTLQLLRGYGRRRFDRRRRRWAWRLLDRRRPLAAGGPGGIGRRLRLAWLLRPRFELGGDRLANLRERQQGLTLQRVALLRRGIAQWHSLFFSHRGVGHVWL